GQGVDKKIGLAVNDEDHDPKTDDVISNVSCRTNCSARLAEVLHEHFGIVNGLMTTVLSLPTHQLTIHTTNKVLRTAPQFAHSIIPTATGAAKAHGEVMPHLNGKLHGMALRVPTPNVSLVDLVVDLKEDVTVEDVNNAFKHESENKLADIMRYTEEPLVSIDF